MDCCILAARMQQQNPQSVTPTKSRRREETSRNPESQLKASILFCQTASGLSYAVGRGTDTRLELRTSRSAPSLLKFDLLELWQGVAQNSDNPTLCRGKGLREFAGRLLKIPRVDTQTWIYNSLGLLEHHAPALPRPHPRAPPLDHAWPSQHSGI